MPRRQCNNSNTQTRIELEEQLLGTIVEDIFTTANQPFDAWQESSMLSTLPSSIPSSGGRVYRLSNTGAKAARKLTQQIWSQRPDIRQRIWQPAFERISLEALGQALKDGFASLIEEIPNDHANLEIDSEFFEQLATDFNRILDEKTEMSGLEMDHHIRCNLFDEDQDVSMFSVGPVDFRPRSEWLEHFVTDEVTRNFVQRVLRRELVLKEISQHTSAERVLKDVRNVVSSLSEYSWVATIRISKHEFEQSYLKASTLVELAIDALGLRFHPTDARRFTWSGHNHLSVKDRLVTLVEDGGFVRDWRPLFTGLRDAPGVIKDHIASELEFLDAAGQILANYLNHRQKGQATDLVERWVNALHWLGEARRETIDAMAVTKYGCALDVLSRGSGNCQEMCEFVEAAIGLPESDNPPSDAISINEAVERVYGEGRSGITHGGTPGLLEDFREQREIGDFLLSNLFYPVTKVLAWLITENSRIDEVNGKNAYRVFKTCLLKNRRTMEL